MKFIELHSIFKDNLNYFSNHWCKWENVEPDALKEWKFNSVKILILVFHFIIVDNIFYPLNLNLLFVILNKVSRMNYVCFRSSRTSC